MDNNVKLIPSVSNANGPSKYQNIVLQPHESERGDLYTLRLEFLPLDLTSALAKKVEEDMQNHLKYILIFITASTFLFDEEFTPW